MDLKLAFFEILSTSWPTGIVTCKPGYSRRIEPVVLIVQHAGIVQQTF